MNATSWNEVLNLVKKDDENKWDIEQDAENLHMTDDGMLIHGSDTNFQPVRLSDFALGQLCGKLELPSRYIKRIPPHLQARCINHDLSRAGTDQRRFMIRCKGQIARAFLSDAYSRVSNLEIMEIFEKLSQGIHHQIRSFHLDARGCWLKILIDDLRSWDPIDTASELKVGLVIGNSEVGNRAISVEPFVYRKACTNDAVIQHDAALNARHIHLKPRELKARIAESMNAALKGGDEALEAFTRACEDIVEDPAQVIKRLAEKRGLSEDQTDQVQLAYQVEPHASIWGVINSFTRAAQNLVGDDRVELERFAGSLLNTRMPAQLAAA